MEIGLVPLGSIGMTVCLLDLYFEHPAAHAPGTALLTWTQFLVGGGWGVALDCALIGVFGGLFIVPLYALILSRSAESHRARIIACNNILNAGFMVIAALLAIVWFELLHLTIPQLFILAAVLNAIVATYIYTLVPEFLMRFLSWVFVNIMYRIKVRGLENIPETGAALIVCNHVSFMDALVIGGSVRRPVRFVMDHNIFKIPVMGFIFRTARAIPIAPGARRSGRAEPGIRPHRCRARRRRSRLHLSRGQTHARRRDERVQARRGKDPRAAPGAGGADGAARTVGQLLQPPRRQGGDDASCRGASGRASSWSPPLPCPADDATAPACRESSPACAPNGNRRGLHSFRALAKSGLHADCSAKINVPTTQVRRLRHYHARRRHRGARRARGAALGPQARTASHATRTSRADTPRARQWHRRHSASLELRARPPHAQLDRGAPMQLAKPRDPAYFRAAARLLRRLHAANVIHNDLAKETNWLVTPDGRPALVDFQLAMTLTRRGALARALGHDDIRHLLKHKRSYLPERLTAREKQHSRHAVAAVARSGWRAARGSIYSSRAGYSAGAIARALAIAAPLGALNRPTSAAGG